MEWTGEGQMDTGGERMKVKRTGWRGMYDVNMEVGSGEGERTITER